MDSKANIMAVTDWDIDDTSSFLNVHRDPSIVLLNDGDAMFVWSDLAPKNQSTDEGVVILYRDSELDLPLYQMEANSFVKRDERVLMWGRASGADVSSGYRWVPFVSDRAAATAEIQPIREAYHPRVQYDPATNSLHLWFWTHVLLEYTGTEYSLDDIKVPEREEEGTLKRVLCHAVGSIGFYWMKDGVFKPYTGVPASDSQYDLIPIFEKPTIISNGAIPNDGFAGMAVDAVKGGGGTVISKPWDIILLNTEGSGEFSLDGDGAQYTFWMAGRRINRATTEPYVHTDYFTWNGVDLRWDLDTALTGTGTSFVWVELNRAPESGEEVAELFLGSAIPDGTDSKYQLRAEIFPLWRVTYEDDIITTTRDLRDSRHLSAMA